ncbi:MAG: hypothetical protein ACLUP8_04290 [Ruminococcus sp.]|uniref:hypothetical protein n=1 Tax=Ruminococcus sp. TaxID=41978 RepID=UPI003992EEC8
MPKWIEYITKTKPDDNDELMMLSTSEKANKRIKFSGIWDWIVDKMTSAVIAKLDTKDKTVLGAINELNSKSPRLYAYANKSNTQSEIIEIESYSTYLVFIKHDGGTNNVIYAIMSESVPKLLKITSSGDVFSAKLTNNKITITSTTNYWTYTIIKMS